ELKSWIKRDIGPRRWRVAYVVASDEMLFCRITANQHVFSIFATADTDHLGCVCRTKRFVPGHRHSPLATLADGCLNAETWQNIFADMKRMEARVFQGPAL